MQSSGLARFDKLNTQVYHRESNVGITMQLRHSHCQDQTKSQALVAEGLRCALQIISLRP